MNGIKMSKILGAALFLFAANLFFESLQAFEVASRVMISKQEQAKPITGEKRRDPESDSNVSSGNHSTLLKGDRYQGPGAE